LDPLIKSQLLYQLSYAPVRRTLARPGTGERITNALPPVQRRNGLAVNFMSSQGVPAAEARVGAGAGQPWMALAFVTSSDHGPL
jgi:hypothetical protein